MSDESEQQKAQNDPDLKHFTHVGLRCKTSLL